MASASSSRSTVTNLSPALSAIFSAVSKTRASSGASRPGRRRRPTPWAASPAPARRAASAFGRTSAGALDQAGRQALRVVEQDLEQVLGAELLVALAQGEALGRLHEALGAIGILVEIHVYPSSARPSAPPARHGTAVF